MTAQTPSSTDTEFHVGRRAAKHPEKECLFDTRNPGPNDHYLTDPHPLYTCKLVEGHDGRHDAEANYRGHLKARPDSTGVELTIEHDHGFGSLELRGREQVDNLVAWLTALADQKWGRG